MIPLALIVCWGVSIPALAFGHELIAAGALATAIVTIVALRAWDRRRYG